MIQKISIQNTANQLNLAILVKCMQVSCMTSSCTLVGAKNLARKKLVPERKINAHQTCTSFSYSFLERVSSLLTFNDNSIKTQIILGAVHWLIQTEIVYLLLMVPALTAGETHCEFPPVKQTVWVPTLGNVFAQPDAYSWLTVICTYSMTQKHTFNRCPLVFSTL